MHLGNKRPAAPALKRKPRLYASHTHKQHQVAHVQSSHVAECKHAMQRADQNAQYSELSRRSVAQKKQRLAIVDALLWQTTPNESASPHTWLSDAWVVSAFHAAVSLMMRCVALRVVDTDVLLFQDTVPGPWQPAAGALRHASCGVAVALVLRSRG